MLVSCKLCNVEFEKLTSEINRTKNNFCSKKCSGSYLKGISESLFYESTKINGECLDWCGAIDSHGYGSKRFKGKVQKAHRVSYTLSFGDIGNNLVLHSCDNRKCVNPFHLFLGSHGDNMNDMVVKGRKREVLTFNQVEEIRKSTSSISHLAKVYGVSYGVIKYAKEVAKWEN